MDEAAWLAEAERVIREHRGAFAEVAHALRGIVENRLYTTRGYGSFEAYAAEHLGYRRSEIWRVRGIASLARGIEYERQTVERKERCDGSGTGTRPQE